MTVNDFRSAGDIHDDEIVQALLAETGINHPADTDLLQPTLMRVRSIAHGPQPDPEGELADLLAALDAETKADTGSSTVSSLEPHRTQRHTRLVIAATVLSLSLGAGAAAAAANLDFRDTVQKTVTTLLNTLTSAANPQRPNTPTPVDAPAPSTPVPGQPTLPGKTVSSGPPAMPPATSDPPREKNVPGPQTNLGLPGSPVTEHPAPPVMPQPAVPHQPPDPPAASAPPHQRGAIPEPPPAAPVTDNHK